MAARNVMVAFNGSEPSMCALRLACLFAQKHKAHVTAVVAHGPSMSSESAPHWVPEKYRQLVSEVSLNAIESIHQLFEETAAEYLARDHIHWVDIPVVPEDRDRASIDQVLAECASRFDLLFMGQAEQLRTGRDLSICPEAVTKACGRPAILVPSGFDVSALNERIVIAWDGSKNAARAIFDAMLFLDWDGEVDLVTVGKVPVVARQNPVNMITGLKRHGKTANKVILPASNRPMVSILKHCEEVNAGLLVAGAYGHSKLIEDVLGAHTSDVIGQARLPLFISH